MRTGSRFVAPLMWLLCLAGTVFVLHRLGTSLALPGMTREAWRTWIISSDAATVTFTMTRLFALVVAWYLLGSTLLSFAAATLRQRSLMRMTDSISFPLVRRFAKQLAGLSLAGAMAIPSPAFATADQNTVDDVPILRAVDSLDAAPQAVTTTTTMFVPSASPSTTISATAPYASAPSRFVQTEPPILSTYTISPGENFWVVADRVITSRLGRPPSPEEVAWYWRELVERNRGSLADGANPDLVFPGQVLQLP